jgi:transcription elongation factor Elf1
MDADWLQAQLRSFTCPACGQDYGTSRMRLLAEREGLYFLDLDCADCGSRTVAIVTVELDDAEGSIADMSTIPQRLPQLETAMPGAMPVTADEVLEMHEFLSRFHGNVSHLFRAANSPLPGQSNRT